MRLGSVIETQVKQALLRSVLPDGTVMLLVVLHDDRCAILRNNEVVHQSGGDAEGIDFAVHQFMVMTQVTDVLGSDAETPPQATAGAAVARPEMSRAAEPTPGPSAIPPAAASRPTNHV